MSGVPITEKMLNEAGGWQVMKHARALVEMDRVVSSNYTPPILKGLVRDGETEYRAGLKIVTQSNVENICSCRQSRQLGAICAHSVAVGLHSLRPRGAELQPKNSAPSAPVVGQGNMPSMFSADAGVPVSLSIILPPSFTQAWEKRSLTVGIEAQVGQKTLLLNALPRSDNYRLSQADLEVVKTVADLSQSAIPPGVVVLDRDQFARVLRALRGHPRISFGRRERATVRPEPLLPPLTFQDSGSETAIEVQLPVEGILLTGKSDVWHFHEGTFQQVSPGLPSPYRTLLEEGRIVMNQPASADFLLRELPVLRDFFRVSGRGLDGDREMEVRPGRPSIVLEVEGSLNRLSGRLQFIYGKRVITSGITSENETFAYRDEANSPVFSRNVPLERKSLERLTKWGFSGPDSAGHYWLKSEQFILPFFSQQLPQLQREWEVKIGSRFTNVTKTVERLEVNLRVEPSGENWFDLDVSLTGSHGVKFDASAIQRLLRSGASHVRLANNRIAVFDPAALQGIEETLRDCDPDQARPGRYRMHRMYAGYLDSVAGDTAGVTLAGGRDWAEWARVPGGPSEMAPVSLGDLEQILRPYQKQGVAWMSFLAGNGLGGILADEMGLGKTLQTLAFAQWLKNERKCRQPILVVCPSSLVFNWEREARLFTPHLSTLAIQGSGRSRLFPEIPNHDIVITSYPLLRRDSRHYQGIQFRLAVLDEAQHIKNPDTQNAQAASQIRAETRFVLTGTPVENSVRDLWSIMNFVLPGYLGNREDFHERYQLPITRDQSPEANRRLNQRMRPFMLRRLKRDVVAELPDKIEQVSYCELGPAQAAAYREVLEQGRRKMDEAAAEKNSGRARIMVLATLLRLRQACCDLRLLGIEQPKSAQNSSKLELLDELLGEAIDGGHRVLLFSQFVSMLTLIRERLEANQIRYSYLDGSTKNRAEVVDEFQGDTEIPVFLISLKAGGTGLNLTAADTVIHFDPWWNPAVEAQATDRAHRIGQKSVVTSYKFIARNTVEEKILNLQQRKRDIIDATVESEEPMMDGLTMDEISSLLE